MAVTILSQHVECIVLVPTLSRCIERLSSRHTQRYFQESCFCSTERSNPCLSFLTLMEADCRGALTYGSGVDTHSFGIETGHTSAAAHATSDHRLCETLRPKTFSLYLSLAPLPLQCFIVASETGSDAHCTIYRINIEICSPKMTVVCEIFLTSKFPHDRKTQHKKTKLQNNQDSIPLSGHKISMMLYRHHQARETMRLRESLHPEPLHP